MKNLPRHSLIATILLGVATTLLGQTKADHTPRNGDQLHQGFATPQSLILSVSGSTKTVLINPDAVVFDSYRDAAFYMDCDTISYVQSATKHRFLLRDDTLSYIGYENRATDFRLDSPVRVAALPLRNGSEVHDAWSGHVLHHGSMILKHAVATVTLFSESGIILTEPAAVTVGTVPHSHSVEAPSGWSRVMLLRVDTGEES